MLPFLGCSWLPLPPWNPKPVSLHDFLFGLFLAAAAALEPSSPFMIPFLGCSWLPRWNPSLSPFMIPFLGCSWLPLPPVSLHDSLSGLLLAVWLPLPPWKPSSSPFMIPFLGCSWLLLGCRSRLGTQSLSPFMIPFLGCSCLVFFLQIAGSYRGSYFSMAGLLIPEIAKWW